MVEICFVLRIIVMKKVINIANIDSILLVFVLFSFFFYAVLLCHDPSLLYILCSLLLRNENAHPSTYILKSSVAAEGMFLTMEVFKTLNYGRLCH